VSLDHPAVLHGPKPVDDGGGAQRLSAEAREQITAAMKRYPSARAALLPALWIAQKDQGWVGQRLAAEVAELLGIPVNWVHEVLSFYVLFHTRPVGRHVIWMCRNLSCYLRGFTDLKAHIERRLGVREGETTPDGAFTLLENECLGACGGAPMIQIDDQYYENLTPERIDAILDEVRKRP
jgi:NADH-quinone oxidoreductase subunit E